MVGSCCGGSAGKVGAVPIHFVLPRQELAELAAPDRASEHIDDGQFHISPGGQFKGHTHGTVEGVWESTPQLHGHRDSCVGALVQIGHGSWGEPSGIEFEAAATDRRATHNEHNAVDGGTERAALICCIEFDFSQR